MNSGYHCGFNQGFNIAEAVNFATPDWLPEFPKFKGCQCHSGSVYLDPFFLKENLEKIKYYKKNAEFKKFCCQIIENQKKQFSRLKKIQKTNK